MIENLTEATPVEVDTVLAVLYRAETGLLQKVETNAHYVRDAADIRLANEKARYGRDERAVGTTADAEAVLQARIDAGGGGIYSPAARAADTLGRLTAAREALAANRAEQAPLHAEFTRRGRWTRSFMVLNSNGHAHSSLSCSTCFPTTRYGWLTEVSGKTEAEVVEALGSDACSTCYPTAPAVKRARTTFAPEEREAQAEKVARDAEKAEKAAVKAARAAKNDLGATVVVHDGYDGTITKVGQAKSHLTGGYVWGWDHSYYPASSRDEVAVALAAKTGETVESILKAAEKRARR